jgi:hypothetical protein
MRTGYVSQPVKAIRRSMTRASGVDRVGETGADTALGRDDCARSAENVLGERVGRGDLLAGGLGEVPGVYQELYREDTEGDGAGYFIRPELDGAGERGTLNPEFPDRNPGLVIRNPVPEVRNPASP